MRVSKRVQYGVIIMVSIGMYANVNTNDYISIVEISNMHNLPMKVLENVVTNLKFNNLVVSQRGCKNGGYKLAKSPQEITMTDIINSLDDTILSENNSIDNCTNSDVALNINRMLWHKINQSMLEITNSITLYTLIESIKT